MLNIISLGAGVQSSTMALMAAHGQITPMPDCAIFSDTGWERKVTYDFLNFLEKQLPFPVYRVSAGNIREDHIVHFATRTTMPLRLNDGKKLSRAMQKCTHDYKSMPIERKMKEIMREHELCDRLLPTSPVITQWRGISVDEAHRMKPASEPWYHTRFPLVDLHIYRGQCAEWMTKHGYPIPPRSSCIGCPNHGNTEWEIIKRESPEEWAQAIEMDNIIRKVGGLDMPAFLHSDGVPLAEADLSVDSTIDMWGNECYGMCNT